MYQRILVPVDGSKSANRAVAVAADMASHYHAKVFLLHVIRNLALPREIIEMMAKGEINESRRELLEDSAEIILENARIVCETQGLSDIDSSYLIGDPARTIANYANEHDIDLIVLGAQGLETQPHLLGSVARKLTNISSVSCLIVQ